ncbi:MAG: PilZ domain-containing protein [Nitrospiraceae bacterium]
MGMDREKASHFSARGKPGSCNRETEALMELRQSPRFLVHCPIAYAGGNLAGVGIVSNLSTGGCKVGSSTPVDPGANIELRIYITGAPEFPMKVDQAVVRWAKAHEFGLEFISIWPEEQVRLRRFIRTLETGQSPDGFPQGQCAPITTSQ